MSSIPPRGRERPDFERGALGWVTRPADVPEATALRCPDVCLDPGEGDDFHAHPSRQEITLARGGAVEQWVGTEWLELTDGDSCFVPAGTVHASFVAAGGAAAQISGVVSPSHGVDGSQTVDTASPET